MQRTLPAARPPMNPRPPPRWRDNRDVAAAAHHQPGDDAAHGDDARARHGLPVTAHPGARRGSAAGARRSRGGALGARALCFRAASKPHSIPPPPAPRPAPQALQAGLSPAYLSGSVFLASSLDSMSVQVGWGCGK